MPELTGAPGTPGNKVQRGRDPEGGGLELVRGRLNGHGGPQMVPPAGVAEDTKAGGQVRAPGGQALWQLKVL